jgi:UDP-4-amino-4,6-dideoxy-N-acetyl-beta-L-altrosamine transaminase
VPKNIRPIICLKLTLNLNCHSFDDKKMSMQPHIPYGRQSVSEADIQAVVDVLRSDFLTQGPVVPAFEKAVAEFCQARHGVAVNSATSALHLACLALELGKGDWLWTSPITFVASANCGLYCGAQIDFVDIDPQTYNMCPRALETKLLYAEKENRLPKVVVPVHLCGQPCDMEAIHALSQRFGFKIIEDASHAIGGEYLDLPIGNCAFSDITVFSFHPVKVITSAEGGMALTNSATLARRMQRLRSHGITRDSAEMTHKAEGPWYYQQIELGFNYRMTEIQAALGLSQFGRLTQFVKQRHFLAKRYETLLRDLPITTPWQDPKGYSGLHLYVIRLQLEKIVKSHREIFSALLDAGIGVNLHYIPVFAQPYYQGMGSLPANYPAAQAYYQEAISLPMYPDMTLLQQDLVIAALYKVLN